MTDERYWDDAKVGDECVTPSVTVTEAMVNAYAELTGDFTPEARLAQHLKDVRLILQTGGRLGAHLPLSRVHETILSEAVDLGLGAEDNSAVIKVFARK